MQGPFFLPYKQLSVQTKTRHLRMKMPRFCTYIGLLLVHTSINLVIELLWNLFTEIEFQLTETFVIV